MPSSVNQRTVKLSPQKNIRADFYNQVIKIEKEIELEKQQKRLNYRILNKWITTK